MKMFREPWDLILGGSPKELKKMIFFFIMVVPLEVGSDRGFVNGSVSQA